MSKPFPTLPKHTTISEVAAIYDTKEKCQSRDARINIYVRKRGKLQDGDKPFGRRGSGTIELIEKGPRNWYLKFGNFNIMNDHRHSLSIYIFSKKVKLKKLELLLSGKLGYLMSKSLKVSRLLKQQLTESYHRTITFEIPLSEEDFAIKNFGTQDIIGVAIGKLADEKPKTTTFVPYAFTNLKAVEMDWSKNTDLDNRIQARKIKLKYLLDNMRKSTALDEGNTDGERGLHMTNNIKKVAKQAFMRFNLERHSRINFDTFSQMLEYLKIYISDAKAARLFRMSDYNQSKTMDFKELQEALRVHKFMVIAAQEQESEDEILKDHLIPMISPWEAFDSFDKNQSGEIDEMEFYEVLKLLQISITPKKASSLFKKNDLDNSGTFDFAEFQKLWLTVADIPDELKNRGYKVITSGKKQKERNIETLLDILEKERVKEHRLFSTAVENIKEKRNSRRVLKEEKRRYFHELRMREERELRKEMAIQLKIDRQRQRFQSQTDAIRNKKELSLRSSLQEQIKFREEEVLKDKEDKRLAQEKLENMERIRKGEDKLIRRNQGYSKIPASFYIGEENKDKLVFILICDFAFNEIEELPSYGFLFWLSGLEKFDISFNKIAELPSEISSLLNLRILDLNNNQIEILPEAIGDLVALEHINISHNHIRSIPASWGKLSNLKSLIGFNNEIKFLPTSIGGMKLLEILELQLNKIEELPDEFSDLISLKNCNLSWNLIKFLPNEIGKLSSLQYLNIECNNVAKIPATFGNLNKLRFMYFGRNFIREIPDCIGGLSHALEIDLSRNRVLRLHQSIGECNALQLLNISHNKLQALPNEIGKLKYLITLNLKFNQISELPLEIGAMVSLHYLDMSYNQLHDSLASPLGTLVSLQELNFSHNQITEFSANMGSLCNLKTLNISNNQLKFVPDTFRKLHNLKHLNVSNNSINKLTKSIGCMESLEVLNLSSNLLTALPREIGNCSKLKELDLYHNMLKAIPSQIAEILPNLHKFNAARNPLGSLPKKWCSDWTSRDKHQVLWSGYTNGELARWTEIENQIYVSAEAEWEKTGYMHYYGRSTLDDFIHGVRDRIGEDKWSESFIDSLTTFYLLSKKNGKPPRYDSLTESETLILKKAALEAETMRDQRIADTREAEERMLQLIEENYSYNKIDAMEHMNQLVTKKSVLDLSLQKKNVKYLKKSMHQHYMKQEKIKNEIELQRQERTKLEYSKLMKMVKASVGTSLVHRKRQLNKNRDPIYI